MTKREFSDALMQLTTYLRERKSHVTQSIDVPHGCEPNPTYGNTDHYETVDFDELLDAIDVFAVRFTE